MSADAVRRVIEVVIDESMHTNPRLTLAGALVFEDSKEQVEEKIRQTYKDVSGSYYLDDERSFRKFLQNGFHANDDLQEVSAQFVRMIGRISGAKLFIEFSDHTLRPDLSAEQTVALLELRLAETIFRKYAWADEIRFTFEQQSALDAHYARIVQSAKLRAGYRGDVQVARGAKKEPPTLAIVDYALYFFAHSKRPDPPDFRVRSWKAIRPMVSSIRSLESGGVNLRRGLVSS